MHTDTIIARLDTHLRQIEARLAHNLKDISGPLGDLVRPQLRQSRPFIRAGVVLTTSYCIDEAIDEAEDAAPQNPRTPALAAAVEMLYIALTLHKRLIRTPSQPPAGNSNTGGITDENLDKTFLGSTILAGDYCFSRASQLAAETEHPHVVAHFAQTLQALSEGLLREAFQRTPNNAYPVSFHEDALLLVAGAEAALILHGIPVKTPIFDRPGSLLPLQEPETDITPLETQKNAPGGNWYESTTHAHVVTLAQGFASSVSADRADRHSAPNGNEAFPIAPDSTADPIANYIPYWTGLHRWWQRSRQQV